MNAVERAREMLATPTRDLPALAVDYAEMWPEPETR